ncbi:MAG: glycosyltransferase [Chloroflexi bacterium]|jgi:dolichyl-phosphate beta-glucosyltransferase|nr:glycosyltransferase [Chloroflexota bacterium]
MTARPTVAVVIPAFNEEARLGATLAAIAAFGSTTGQRPAVVVADDGSTDRTVAVARQAGQELELDLAILGLPHAGKAWAVRSGMLHAAATSDADHVLMLDADNEIAIDHLADVPWADDPATIYIGRRVGAVGARTGARPTPFRRLMSAGMRTLSRLLLGLPYPDTQCGFKLFPRAMIPGLFGQQRARGWVFDAEILVIARRSGLPVVEVPVVWSPRGVSRVRPTAALTSLAGLAGIAVRRARGRYWAVPRPVSR